MIVSQGIANYQYLCALWQNLMRILNLLLVLCVESPLLKGIHSTKGQ